MPHLVVGGHIYSFWMTDITEYKVSDDTMEKLHGTNYSCYCCYLQDQLLDTYLHMINNVINPKLHYILKNVPDDPIR